MRKTKRSIHKIMLLSSMLLFCMWLLWVVYYNHRIKERDMIPVQNFPIGTFAELGSNYCYGDYFDGISICANNYKILDTDIYLKEKGLSRDNFESLTDKICIVDLTVRYQATETQILNTPNGEETYMDIDMGIFFMCGQDYYECQNNELYCIENPLSNGDTGIRFFDSDECNVKLVFNLTQRFYTNSSWKRIEDLPRMIYLTGSPVQTNIILHE